jgi:hypothetical protein
MSLADSSPRLRININEVDDAEIISGLVLLKLKNGETIKLPAEKPEARQIYWQVKIRNRRRAFGL